jgi:hypothetical protein
VADTSDWDPQVHTTATAIAWAAHWFAAYTGWRIAGGPWPTEGYRPRFTRAGNPRQLASEVPARGSGHLHTV